MYLEGEGLPAGTPIEAQIAQQERQFSPEVVVIPAGSTVSFSNSDPVLHNVFSLSKTKQFDLGYYPVGKARLVKFDKPGVAEVYCHLHRERTAAVVVAPSAFYGQPSKDGRFALTGVPAGEYTLVLWHKSAGFFRKRVRVPENGPAEVVFAVPVADSKTGVKTP